VRNLTLYALLEAFTTDAGMRLTLAASSGDEIPFEVVASDSVPVRGARQDRQASRRPLYCYRPLTSDFIRERLGLLVALPTYAPAVRALEGVGGTDAYLRARGELKIPDTPRELADTALRLFLWRVFEERSEFSFDDVRFELAYGELERAIYRGRCVTEMVAPLLGIDLDPVTDELALGDGLSIVRPQSLGTAPAELMNGEQPPLLLLVLRVAHDRAEPPAVAFARSRFRSVLTALRLYEKGAYAIGTIGYARIDDGVWSPVALGSTGRPRLLTLIPAASEASATWSRAACGGRRAVPCPTTRGPGRSCGRSHALRWALSARHRSRRSPTTCWRSGLCWSRRGPPAAGWRNASP
jgi:hypothetical protein